MKARIKETVLGAAAIGLLFVGLIIGGTSDYEVAKADAEYAEEHPETMVHTYEDASEQQYIVRYGTAYHWGAQIITEDGNIWGVIDPPELPEGTRVRVLFDSNGTRTESDDTIVDIIELDV